MVENKIEIMPFLYNAAPIPGHLLTKRNLVTIPVQCHHHSWTFTTKQRLDLFFWKCNCPGITSHCTGIDRTLPPTRYSSSSGEPPRRNYRDCSDFMQKPILIKIKMELTLLVDG